MEIKHRLNILSDNSKYNKVKKKLDRLGVKYRVTNLGKRPNGKDWLSLEYYVSESDELYSNIDKIFEKHKLWHPCRVYYSQQEVEEAEWLYIETGEFQYPQPEDDYKEATYDTSNYCKRCGMGASQNNPFRLSRDFKQKNSQFLGLHWVFDETFLRPETKAMLEHAGTTGISYLHPVFNKTGEKIKIVFQMKVDTIIEGGLITDELIKVTCMENNEEGRASKGGGSYRFPEGYPFCGKVKYHWPDRTTIKFHKEKLDGVPDVIKSDEYFGSGGSANRLIMVSKKFRELITSHKLRGLQFTPIELVG